jgi:RNA polymerase sigma-70 factor (ECF subfamily)
MSEVSRADVAAPQRAPGTAHRVLFDEFYAAELPRLVALARGLAHRQVAEDVAQEAMLVAYRRWREVGDLERPDLWVRRTCANLAVSQFRRKLVEVRVLAKLAGRRQPSAELSPQGEEFWAAVRALPRRQAQSAALRYDYDMPIADIADTLGTSEGTVKQHLSRARTALARTLGVREEER